MSLLRVLLAIPVVLAASVVSAFSDTPEETYVKLTDWLFRE
jgi:hypothetical protein